MDYLAVASAIVAVIGATIAYWSLRQERRLAEWIMSYSRLNAAEAMLADYPTLLRLHGITDEMLEAHGVDVNEVVYLLRSFRAGQELSRLRGSNRYKLTPYRETMLSNARVQLIWREFLHGSLVFQSPFTAAVNDYIERRLAEEAS